MERLNEMLGHDIIFKAEATQITGAFKIRGVLNTILSLKEQGMLPMKLVAYSSGNHAKAIAWAGAEIANLPTEIYMHKSASLSKQEAIRALGANLIITDTRIEAETRAREAGKEQGNYFLHPSDNDMVIAGAATLAYEAFEDLKEESVDAVFAACGGGALLSGTYLGTKAAGKFTKIYGAEPAIANDAATSYKLGKIVGFDESPQTMADGLRTLKVSTRTFAYLQKLDGFVEASEEEILYWSIWLNHLLSVPCEPTAALTMACVFNWLKLQTTRQKILVILSGGNIDNEIASIFKT
ncbi:MAG: serine/threonine dehydratase, partial [Pseudomonadales bacterium 32-42-5]